MHTKKFRETLKHDCLALVSRSVLHPLKISSCINSVANTRSGKGRRGGMGGLRTLMLPVFIMYNVFLCRLTEVLLGDGPYLSRFD